jgi:hypothetical protein
LEEITGFFKGSFNQDRVLRLLAWIGGTAISTIWLVLLGIAIFSETAEVKLQLNLEGLLLIILILCSAGGVLLSMKNIVSGGKMIIISSLFLSIYSYFAGGQNRLFAVAYSGLPFLLVGLLLLQSVPPELRKDR